MPAGWERGGGGSCHARSRAARQKDDGPGGGQPGPSDKAVRGRPLRRTETSRFIVSRQMSRRWDCAANSLESWRNRDSVYRWRRSHPFLGRKVPVTLHPWHSPKYPISTVVNVGRQQCGAPQCGAPVAAYVRGAGLGVGGLPQSGARRFAISGLYARKAPLCRRQGVRSSGASARKPGPATTAILAFRHHESRETSP
jgi:hypothetical protein